MITGILYCVSITSVQSLENNKNSFALYYGSKVYEERHPFDDSFFMSQDGFMIGVQWANDSYDEDVYNGWSSKIAIGSVDYTSAGSGTMENIMDYQIEEVYYLGIPFEHSDSRTTVFSGIGGRFLLNASGNKLTSTGHCGYDRESRYVYLPLGINFEKDLFEFRGEYLYFLYGQQTSKISQCGYSSDVTNDQEEGSGIKLSLKIYTDNKQQNSSGKNFGYEFYMDYWDIADSKLDESGNFMEPRNTTAETGVKVFWSF